MSAPVPVSPPAIDRLVLVDAPSVTVARVTLGLTLYLAEPLTWAREGAGRALERFLEVAPTERLRTYTTSHLTHWQPVSPGAHAELVRSLSLPWSEARPRHLFTFELADDTFTPSVGFTYREVDYSRNRRAGVLEVTLPEDSDPEVLATLTGAIAECGPFFCGVGGYTARWYPARRRMALEHLERLCRRYWGVDVQDPVPFSWDAEQCLPGSNWLTLVGHGLADARRLDVKSLLAGGAGQGVRATRLSHGILVRAGDATVGDLNRLKVPDAYAEAARWLSPAFSSVAPVLPDAWQRRFLAPDGWSDPG